MPRVRNRFDAAQLGASLISGGLQGYRQGKNDANAQRVYEQRMRALVEAEEKERQETERRQVFQDFARQRFQRQIERTQQFAQQVEGGSAAQAEWARGLVQRAQERVGTLEGIIGYLDPEQSGDLGLLLEEEARFQKNLLYAEDVMRTRSQVDSAVRNQVIPPETGQQLQELLMNPAFDVGPKEVRERLDKAVNGKAAMDVAQARLQEGIGQVVPVFKSAASMGVPDEHLEAAQREFAKWTSGGYEEEPPSKVFQRVLRIMGGADQTPSKASVVPPASTNFGLNRDDYAALEASKGRSNGAAQPRHPKLGMLVREMLKSGDVEEAMQAVGIDLSLIHI